MGYCLLYFPVDMAASGTTKSRWLHLLNVRFAHVRPLPLHAGSVQHSVSRWAACCTVTATVAAQANQRDCGVAFLRLSFCREAGGLVGPASRAPCASLSRLRR